MARRPAQLGRRAAAPLSRCAGAAELSGALAVPAPRPHPRRPRAAARALRHGALAPGAAGLRPSAGLRALRVGMMRRWMPWLSALLVLGALVLVAGVLRQFSWAQVAQSLHRLSASNLALAVLFTAGSYLALTGFDYLGLRYAGRRLPYRLVALASFTSLSIGHTVGLSPLSSGAVRYRFYARYGLSPGAVANVILFSAATVALGELGLAAIALLANP